MSNETILHLCSICFHEKESCVYEKCNDCSGLNWINSLVEAEYLKENYEEKQEKYRKEEIAYTRIIKIQKARPRRSNRLIEKKLYAHSMNNESAEFQKLNQFYHELNNSTLKSIV